MRTPHVLAPTVTGGSRLLGVAAAGALLAAVAGCGHGSGTDPSSLLGDDISQQTISFTGTSVPVVAPAGAASVFVIATGGSGGQGLQNTVGPPVCAAAAGNGAVVLGTLPVQPGQTLTVSVGGAGQGAGCSGATTSAGGWAAMGAGGGAGLDGYEGDRVPSGGGGGATIIQAADGSVVAVAGGGGGGGAVGFSPSIDPGGAGGSANGNGVSGAGANGQAGHGPAGGLEGVAGLSAAPGGENGGHGGSGGGDGGAGGGGAGHGGSGGKGGQFGGGGGGGGGAGLSTAAALAGSSITTASTPGNGSVQLTWCDASGCE